MSAELCICPVEGVHMRGCNEGGLLTDVDAPKPERWGWEC